ncbi:MAG: hypothetical protein AB7G93_00865 [Bdellovibrionales bacterium]
MTENQIRNWEKMRVRGKGSFILWQGVVSWGIPVALGMTIYEYFRDNNLSITLVVSYFLTFPCAGYFYGMFLWNYKERRYRRSITNTEAG